MKIDQAGLSAGVAGRARDDGLSTGALVTLTSLSHTARHEWALLWVGIHGVVDTTSRATLQPAGPAGVSFSPTPGALGSWRIELVTDRGTPAEDRQVRIFAIKGGADKLRIPAANEQADPEANLINSGAAYVARSEFNAGDGIANSPQNAATYVSHWRPVADLIHAQNTSGGGGGGAPGACAVLTLAASNHNVVLSPGLLSCSAVLTQNVAESLGEWSGLAAPAGSVCYWLRVLHAGEGIGTFLHESSGSSAANRFVCMTGADISFFPGQTFDLVYDPAISRWRVFGGV